MQEAKVVKQLHYCPQGTKYEIGLKSQKIPKILISYIFAVFLCAAGLGAKVKPSHRSIFPARQEGVGVVWYGHNLMRQKAKGLSRGVNLSNGADTHTHVCEIFNPCFTPRKLFRSGTWTDTVCSARGSSPCGCSRWCHRRSTRRSPGRWCVAWTWRWRCLPYDLTGWTSWPVNVESGEILPFTLDTHRWTHTVTQSWRSSVYWPKENKICSDMLQMVNGLHLYSDTPKHFSMASHLPIHASMGATAMQGAAHAIRSNLGLSVCPRTQWRTRRRLDLDWQFYQQTKMKKKINWSWFCAAFDSERSTCLLAAKGYPHR